MQKEKARRELQKRFADEKNLAKLNESGFIPRSRFKVYHKPVPKKLRNRTFGGEEGALRKERIPSLE